MHILKQKINNETLAKELQYKDNVAFGQTLPHHTYPSGYSGPGGFEAKKLQYEDNVAFGQTLPHNTYPSGYSGPGGAVPY